MLEELKYRWELRKYLKAQHALYRAFDELPEEEEDADESPRRGARNELLYQTQATDYFRSKYLLEKAYRYHMPIPEDEESWIQPRGAPERFLTTVSAQKLRADMLAHEAADLLVIDDHALLPEGGLDPAPAIVLELVADCSHCCNDGGVVGTDRFVVESETGDSHQLAPLGKA